MRDDFSAKTKDLLAKRVGYLCSNPKCRMATVGPHSESDRTTNIGVAAHVTAASAGGPRFSPTYEQQQRESVENGIWLCQSCSKLIDSDVVKYSVAVLRAWKSNAEKEAGDRLNKQLSVSASVPMNNRIDWEHIKPNGLYEKEFGGQKIQYYLIGDLLHFEHESSPGVITYGVLDKAGNLKEIKLPFPIGEYAVEIPENLVLGKNITKLPNGGTREDVRMKWGKSAIIVRDAKNILTDVHIEGGSSVNHILKKFIVAPPAIQS